VNKVQKRFIATRAAAVLTRHVAVVAQFNEGKIMNYRQLIEAALVAVIDAVENPDSDQGLASAEKAIALLKTYLYEVDICK
jgi:hypothetical protein